MSFTYTFGANPTIDYPRLLISDTVNNPPTQPCVFQDEEITAMYGILSSVWQTGQFYSFPGGRTLPTSPVSYLRMAGMLLNSIAANKSRLSSITQLLDVKLSPDKAAQALRDQAKAYFELDDDAGAFAIIEQCPNEWTFRDRYWKQVQRQSAL